MVAGGFYFKRVRSRVVYSEVWRLLLFLLLRDEDVCLNIKLRRCTVKPVFFHQLSHNVIIV